MILLTDQCICSYLKGVALMALRLAISKQKLILRSNDVGYAKILKTSKT